MNAETTASSSSKILVVDDDMVIQRTLTTALKKAGYQVFTAADISAALSTVRLEKPDLMLLDISFPPDVGGPAKDGFFVVEWLRRTPEAQIIPIIIISATDPAKYKDQVPAKGIVACFRKPLNHQELLAAIKATLDKNAVPVQPIGAEI
jgi:two-component system OmpR family response regulator